MVIDLLKKFCWLPELAEIVETKIMLYFCIYFIFWSENFIQLADLFYFILFCWLPELAGFILFYFFSSREIALTVQPVTLHACITCADSAL